MADGAPRLFGKKRSLHDAAEDADPRFAIQNDDQPKRKSHGRSSFGGSPKKRPRIAFTGEEYGFGYQAAGMFIKRATNQRGVADGGASKCSARTDRDIDAEATDNRQFAYKDAITQPLRTKEQALMAVTNKTADFAIVPFYSPYAGYDFETLRTLSNLFATLGVEQVEATDKLCLAVHESQLYDLIQSSHPGTGFSALQRRMRKSWGGVDAGSGNKPGNDYEAEMPRAGLPIDMADQKLIRDRISKVYAGPEAARRCKSKLDGLRAIGIDVQEIAQMIEPHRELAKMARSTANSTRQTNTYFDPKSGDTHFVSSLGAESQAANLFGMVLPYEVAMRSSDYLIIDHDFDDAPEEKTRFMVVENNPDLSVIEDKYRTTDAKTRYWVRRLQAVANPEASIGKGLMQFIGLAAGSLAILMMIFGVYGLSASSLTLIDVPASMPWLSSLTSTGTAAVGAALAAIAWVLLSTQSSGEHGVRVMFRFRRDGTAASIGDVENFLRNYGVRHTVVRIGEDCECDSPASIVLDVEFAPEDFSYGPFAAISRRMRGSVVNGALKKAFQRWKNRGVTILAAMPFDKPQLPRHKARRWWSEAVGDWTADFVETMFIRFTRLIVFYAIPALAIGYLIWKLALNG
jgi:prephenate dehydratase